VKEKNEIPFGNLVKKEGRVINRDLAVFAFFLFLSFIFWYLNSLGKVMESGIRYQMKYINVPRERVIVNEPADKLNISLKGTGYSILKLKISENRLPVLIDMSKVNYKRVPGSKDPDYYIITSGIVKSLSLQLRSGCEITSIKPDTLFFTMSKSAAGYVVAKPDQKRSGDRK
jgi:hypothetical protein